MAIRPIVRFSISVTLDIGSLNTVPTPLNQLGEAELCPGSSVLDQINAALR